MATQKEKLSVLARIGRALNQAGVTWAVGASLLLYFHGKTDEFHDIDLMTTEEDAPRVKELLLMLGTLAPPNPNAQYRTKAFYEFCIGGVDVDVMAGFAILSDGVVYDCPLQPSSIAGFAEVNGTSIPLQSLAQWRRYYALMGRLEKVAMIDRPSPCTIKKQSFLTD